MGVCLPWMQMRVKFVVQRPKPNKIASALKPAVRSLFGLQDQGQRSSATTCFSRNMSMSSSFLSRRNRTVL